jgi:hypothetical protein
MTQICDPFLQLVTATSNAGGLFAEEDGRVDVQERLTNAAARADRMDPVLLDSSSDDCL